MTCYKCSGISHLALITNEGGFKKYNVCRSCLPRAEAQLRERGIQYKVREIRVQDKRWI